MENLRRIDVDKHFAIAVKQLGGEVLDETLPAQRDFKNADYLFRADGIVAELKRLDEDKTADPGFRAKLTECFEKLIDDGLVSCTNGLVKATNPLALQRLLDIYQNRLATVVKKANLQIRETVARLQIPDAKGLLLLANDGDMAFEFNIVMFALGRLITKDKFTSINEVVYFVPNDTTNVPGYFSKAMLWAPASAPDRPEIDRRFIERLCAAWMNRVATVNGFPVIARKVDGAHYADIGAVKLNDARTIKLTPRR